MDIHTFIQKIHKSNPVLNSTYFQTIDKLNKIQDLFGKDPFREIAEIQNLYLPLNELHSLDLMSLQSKLNEIDRFSRVLDVDFNKFKGLEYNLEELFEEEANEHKVIELVDETRRIIKNIYKENELITKVDPRDFEKIIAELLHYKGYEVELTKRTRDGGYDVIALTKVGGIPFKMLAECKRHKNAIGIEVIRSFCDVIREENANKGVIFTTSYFSKPSKDRKNKLGHLLDLKEKDDIIEWIIDYNENKIL